MSWATQYITILQSGQTVQLRPHGNSMQGRIESGQLVTLDPITIDTTLVVGDIVLTKVNGKQFLHLIKAIGSDGRFQIGNNKGHVNGWCTLSSIFGKCVAIQD
jgi:hypothetical protein